MSDNIGKGQIKTTKDFNAKPPAPTPTKEGLTMAAVATYIDPEFLKVMKAGSYNYIVEVGARYGDESLLLSDRFQGQTAIVPQSLRGPYSSYWPSQP